MRKVLTFLGVSLCLSLVVPAVAQTAPDMFKDVPKDHWAYSATEALRAKNIVVGYPDGYFKGKRTLTRYEFAVALDRALKSIPTPNNGQDGKDGKDGAPGEIGPAGPQGEQGVPGMTPEEVENIKKLAETFKDELASLGNNIGAINKKLDALTKRVAEIESVLNKMPKISGGVFFGFRADRAAGGAFDQDGRAIAKSTLLSNPQVVHDFVLGVDAKIGDGGTISAALVNGNYKAYEGNSFASVNPSVVNGNSDTYLDKLEIKAPFSGVGKNGSLTLGRFPYKVSELTLWKPVVDSYLTNPFVEDDMYRVDGVKLNTGIGSLGIEVVAASTKSVTGGDNTTLAFNSPVMGKTGIPFTGSSNVAVAADKFVGVNASVPFHFLKGGYVRLTGTSFAANDPNSAVVTANGFNNLLVLGADTKIGLTDRINFAGNYAKSITGNGRFDSVNTGANSAFDANFDFKSGGLSLAAGYRYIDPLFYAPGYWGRIGNWVNPTNIQGPTFRVGYDFSSNFGLSFGGDMYTAARNRGGFTSDDDINRVLVGLKWGVAKNFVTTVDWEGVYTKLAIGGGNVHPTEHYITLGTGYNLTSNALVKLGYQIGAFDPHGLGTAAKANFNTFTSSVAVKF